MFKIFVLMFFAMSSAHASLSVLVYDTTTKQPVISENADQIRPVASITKLMTAIISLETYGLNSTVNITKKATRTVKDLLTSLLVKSDNYAAEILARNHPQGRSAFINAMNEKARALGLQKTHFEDPSGLINTNTSTANELVILVETAGRYEFIRRASTQVTNNTNKTILEKFSNVVVSKTGFTSKAGRCLVMLVDNQTKHHAIVILGESNKEYRDNLAKTLLLTLNK